MHFFDENRKLYFDVLLSLQTKKKTMEKVKFDVPKRVLNTKKMEEKINSLHNLLTKANDAYKELKKMGDFASQMPDLSTLTYSFAEAITNKAIQAIESNEAMTFAEKQEAVKRWRDLQDRANSFISTISKAQEAMPLQEAEGLLICPTIEEIAKEQSFVAIPEQAPAHYEKLMAVVQAVEELREFEKKNEIPSLHLIDLTTYLNADAFAVQWAFGIFAPADEATKRAREKYGYHRPENKY